MTVIGSFAVGTRGVLYGLLAIVVAAFFASTPARAQDTFTTFPPGAMQDNYGVGSRDYTQYAPGMRFPIGATTTTLNSQLRNPGSMFVAGSQCDPRNYNEIWRDTYCETREGKRRDSLNCRSREIHQGVDIRGGTHEDCRSLVRGKRDIVPVLAVYDGVIEKVTSYTVFLRTDRGTFRYLHLNMKSLAFDRNALPHSVKAGDLIGYLSNDFGSTPTTFHLHFEHWMAIAGKGLVPVPVYCDLVLAYERDRGKRHVMADGSQRCDGAQAPADSGTAATAAAGTAVSTETAASGSASAVVVDPAKWAAAPAASFWRYNGSDLKLVAKGDQRTLVYETPRAELASLATKGTLFFEGRKDGDRYIGKATVFAPGCSPQAYDVEGPVEDGGKRIVLRGSRPELGADCSVKETKPDRIVVLFQKPGTPPADAGGAPASSPGADVAAGNGAVTPKCTRERCVDRTPFLTAFRRYYNASNRRDFNAWQADALNAVLNVWDTTDALNNDSRLAYILGTIYHESAHSIYPVREGSCETDEGAVAYSSYIFRKKITKYPYYQRDDETKQAYYGRGQVQITFKRNYESTGGKLGLGDQLVQQPDDTLSYDISARLAVLGAYHGWYTGKAVKNFAFDDPADWERARDVIIGARRGAVEIAGFSRKFLTMLSFIDNATFQRKYGPTGGAAAVVAAEPVVAPPAVASEAPEPQPETSAGSTVSDAGEQPAPTPTGESTTPTAGYVGASDPLIAEANRRLSELDALADDLQQRSLDLSLKVAAVKGVLDLAARKSAAGSGAKSAEDDDGMAKAGEVDLRSVWPPGHKPSAACRLTGDKAGDEPVLDPDDPLVMLYPDLVQPGDQGQSP